MPSHNDKLSFDSSGGVRSFNGYAHGSTYMDKQCNREATDGESRAYAGTETRSNGAYRQKTTHAGADCKSIERVKSLAL